MAARRKFAAETLAPPMHDGAALAQHHLAHIASIRAARVHHRAIAQEIRILFDTVASESVPETFLNALNDKIAQDSF